MDAKTPAPAFLWFKAALACCASGVLISSALAANVTANSATTIANAINNAKNGDVITIQSGSYNMSGKAPLKLSASSVSIVGSGVTLDFAASASSSSGRGIDITGSSNLVRGLTIKRAPDNGIHIEGNGNTIDRCITFQCFDTGIQISGKSDGSTKPANNKIVNCDSHDNFDTAANGGNADGFAAKISIGAGNSFTGCVAHDNSDDGWDTFPKAATGTFPVTISRCVAYHNGFHNNVSSGNGNGFKVGSDATGGANHKIDHSIAITNKSKGFDQNHNMGRVTIDHCTGSDCGADEFAFSEFTNGGTFTKNVCNGSFNVKGTLSGNVTSGITFVSKDPTKMTRDGNGNLVFNSFMKFANSGGAGANP